MNKVSKLKDLKEERKIWEKVLQESLSYSGKNSASRMIQEIDREIEALSR